MKMAKIYMYAHGGSGNHGCEAIVRSTCDMLNNPLWDEILLISSKTEERCTVIFQNNFTIYSGIYSIKIKKLLCAVR